MPEKQRLADRIANFVMDLECYFWTGRDAPVEAAADARALGVLDSLPQRSVIASAMQHEICPGLDAIGLSGSTIWAKRRPATATATTAPARLVLTIAKDQRERSLQRGAEWLSQTVLADGSLRLTLDASTGAEQVRGDFYHGRAAIVLMALERVLPDHAISERLRRFLERQVALVLSGEVPEAWPTRPDAALGTLALLKLARVEHPILNERVKLEDFGSDPAASWHLAQVVAAQGDAAGQEAWARCREALKSTPWPCWTALAARKLDDQSTLARAVRNLQSALAPLGPAGECQGPSLPLALVAAAVEGLAPETADEARQRIRAAQRYLMRWQIDDTTPDVDLRLGLGAFPLVPNDTTLRADVTAHALLALAACP